MRLFRRLAAYVHRREITSTLSLIDQQSHGSRATYVGNNRVLVKAVVENKTLAFYVEADDRLISPWFIITGQYETDLTSYFTTHLQQNSNCLDVGSNFGFFTCLMARFCPHGTIVGIEPDRHVFDILRDNIAINGFQHASALHAAASDKAGEATLYRRVSRSGNTSILNVDTSWTDHLGEVPAQPFIVTTMRVDDLLDKFQGRVDFMKIDVEGAEPLVIAGAVNTIAVNPKISIVMEWSPGQMQAAGFELSSFVKTLEKLKLRPWDIEKGNILALSFDELTSLPYRAGILLKR